MEKDAIRRMDKLLKDKDMNIEYTPQKRIIESIVSLIVLCGSESWTARKLEKRTV